MRYVVMVPEFWFNARMHHAGDIIEAADTTEINTNVALRRLKLENVLAPPSEPLPKRTDPPPRLTIVEAIEEIPAPTKRKYMRRDMTAD